MDLLLFILGILLIFGSLIYLVVTLIRKTFSKKFFRNLILSGVALSFIGLVIGVATTDSDTVPEKAVETTTKPKEENQEEKDKKQEEEKLKAEQIKKEEDMKEKEAKEKEAQEAARKKKEEEAKQKEIEEAKKKEELAKKEAEEKRKQEAKQTEPKTEKPEKAEIDTSVYKYAEKVEVTDAIDITQHVTVFVDIPNENVPGQSVINVLSDTYDFLQQDDMSGAKTVTIAVRQNGIKIAQFTINKDKFVPDDDQPMAGQVVKAAEIETLSNEVREYGSVMELW